MWGGWSGVGWIGKGDGSGVKMLSLVGLGCDWAIVCGVCYYPNLLQMQQIHPKPRPRLVITNSADNTCYHPNMLPYGNKNHVK